MKHTQFILGFVVGGLVFGGGAVFAANYVNASPSDNVIKVDGKIVTPQAYLIEGHNYVQLKDLAELVDFGLVWDGRNSTVNIDTTVHYTPQAGDPNGSTGFVQVPQTGELFIPDVGDSIVASDGSGYEIKDMSQYNREAFLTGPMASLPEPSCDWKQFPKVDKPAVTAERKKSAGADYLYITNYHEMRRMQYTLYNAICANPATWENGGLKRSAKGSPLVKIQFGIPADASSVQSFWPWYGDRLTDAFKKHPTGTYYLDVKDVYKDGAFLRTEYKFVII